MNVSIGQRAWGKGQERPSGAEARAIAVHFAARRKLCTFKACLSLAMLAFLPMASPGQARNATSPTPHGQVIFSRSTDENGQTTTTAGPAAVRATEHMAGAPIATDTEREAVDFTSIDLDVHLRPADHYIAVRAILIARNDGKTPLVHLPLQLSSSLTWDSIRLDNRDTAFQVATLNSDADHTGQLHEATVTLPTPLAPGGTARLDVTYSGTIEANAQRLVAIGTPQDMALHTDWDTIGTAFTGLRGFGDVVWYPAASAPAILGDGARLFDEIGRHKLRMAGARFRLRLTVEFPNGQAPTVALINGHPCPLTITGGVEEIPGVATAELPETVLGFEAPSLFVAIAKPEQATNTTLWTRPGDEPNVDAWAQAAAAVTPFLQGWLGKSPRARLTILDLPDPADAPFETGPLLVTALKPATEDVLDGVLVHALAHAWMMSPRAWLSEGVAHFMGTLWLEKTAGREKALESLEAERPALALAEPASPGTSPGQPLAEAYSPIYYREKAAYVFWMLRDLVGDAALSAALRAYNPVADANQSGVAGNFEKLIEQASLHRNIDWFFADWVDADKGLPDLSIVKVIPEAAQAGNTLVGVTISNSGYAQAEVPVTVSTPYTSVTQRVVVPARGSVTPRILIPGAPTRVQVNDGTVPEVEASEHVTTLGGAQSSSSSSLPDVQ